MIRIAAVGDIHYGRESRPEMRSHFESLAGKADLLLIAGDLTQTGTLIEAEALSKDLKGLSLPVVTVLGNHDYHQDKQEEICSILRDVGVTVLEGASAVFDIRGSSVGVFGIKGFGGGFFGGCCTEFGEPEMKAFARHARKQAERLRTGLEALDTDFRFALTHFSPVEETLYGEKKEIFPFLGSYLLAEAIDAAGADAAFHGHAHMGKERANTPGGIPVRNVAMPVIRHAYNIYVFNAPRVFGTASPGLSASAHSNQASQASQDEGADNQRRGTQIRT